MQHLQSLNLLEERIQRAVELITYLKGEKKRLEVETAQLVETQRQLERRVDALVGEKQDLVEESRLLRSKQDEWVRFERDREEGFTNIELGARFPFFQYVSPDGFFDTTFVFGLVVLMLFYARLQWFPPGRLSDWAGQVVQASSFVHYTGMNTIDALLNGRLDIFLDALRHLVLPILTLAYIQWALLLKVTRSSMLESLRQDYVTTARAKGLSERAVINRHARPNAMIPVITISGFTIVGLLNGVIITETIFNYPGIGSIAAAAAVNLDVLTVLGFTLFNGLILLVANLVVDVMYAVIDPRVR